jgi:hypothetical protein
VRQSWPVGCCSLLSALCGCLGSTEKWIPSPSRLNRPSSAINAAVVSNRSMARRPKISPEQIRATLFTTRTEWGHKIYPADVALRGWQAVRCPQCGAVFEPEAKGRAGRGTLPAIEGIEGKVPSEPIVAVQRAALRSGNLNIGSRLVCFRCNLRLGSPRIARAIA